MAKRLGRPVSSLNVRAEERAYLERQVRRDRVPRSFSDRCRMILRFLKDRIEGLYDAERGTTVAFSVLVVPAPSRMIGSPR